MSSVSKSQLRAQVLAARRALPPELHRTFSLSIARRLAALPVFARARTIALYAQVGAEVDTCELARRAALLHQVVAWPRIVEGARELAFAVGALEALVPGPRGTRQPPPGATDVALEQLDLICVPGVAFDPSLRRLGRGGGYYDATLQRLPATCLRVALAFECQVVPDVPAEPHDIRVDLLVTEDRIVGPAAPGMGGSGDAD